MSSVVGYQPTNLFVIFRLGSAAGLATPILCHQDCRYPKTANLNVLLLSNISCSKAMMIDVIIRSASLGILPNIGLSSIKRQPFEWMQAGFTGRPLIGYFFGTVLAVIYLDSFELRSRFDRFFRQRIQGIPKESQSLNTDVVICYS